MSTPIKPPGAPTAEHAGALDRSSSGPDRPDAAEPGAFQKTLADADGTGSPEELARATGLDATQPGAPEGPGAAGASPVEALVAEVRSGTLTVDGAMEQLIGRALEGTAGLPDGHRATLEAQMRDALSEDPTLLALRRELERASTT